MITALILLSATLALLAIRSFFCYKQISQHKKVAIKWGFRSEVIWEMTPKFAVNFTPAIFLIFAIMEISLFRNFDTKKITGLNIDLNTLSACGIFLVWHFLHMTLVARYANKDT